MSAKARRIEKLANPSKHRTTRVLGDRAIEAIGRHCGNQQPLPVPGITSVRFENRSVCLIKTKTFFLPDDSNSDQKIITAGVPLHEGRDRIAGPDSSEFLSAGIYLNRGPLSSREIKENAPDKYVAGMMFILSAYTNG